MLKKYFCPRLNVRQKVNQKLFIVLLSVLVFGWSSCSTELEVNAPKREVRVTYCILDPDAPFQTARISKGFLSDNQPATDVAKNNPDSSLYKKSELEVVLLEIDPRNNQVLKSYPMRDSVITNKDSGVFYSPNQMIFKTDNFLLQTQSNYRLRITNKISKLRTEAVTNIVGKDLSITSPIADRPNDPIAFNWRRKADLVVRVRGPKNAVRIQGATQFEIEVEKLDGSTYRELWYWSSPGLFKIGGSGGEGIYGGGGFFEFMKDEALKRGNEGIIGRRILNTKLLVSSVNNEYNNYILVNGNYNVITQSIPTYTNFNQGMGILGSRAYQEITIKPSNLSLDSLRILYPEFKLK
jgi:hypothetical protein